MDLANDPELIELYRNEMSERVDILMEGSLAMVDDAFPAGRLDEMRREAHTVKGTSRVMGMRDAGDAGDIIEAIYTEILGARRVPSIGLGRGLTLVCRALQRFLVEPLGDHGIPEALEILIKLADDPMAADELLGPLEDEEVEAAQLAAGAPGAENDSAGDDATDTYALDSANDVSPIDVEPNEGDQAVLNNVVPIGVLDTSPQFYNVPPNPRSDDPLLIPINFEDIDLDQVEDAIAKDDHTRSLGGLLEAPELWINSETTGVATARLYEIINRAAELRLDTESLITAVERLAQVEDLDQMRAMVGALRHGVKALALGASAMQQQTISVVAVPMTSVLSSLPALVRFLAKRTGKDVRFEILGDEETELDRGTLDRVADVIRQLLVNAIVHGLKTPDERAAQGKEQTGTLTLNVQQEEDHVRLTVTDDGTGINWKAVRDAAVEKDLIDPNASPSTAELQTLLFNESISTASEDDELGGSGDGLSMVSTYVQDLHGSIELRSVAGVGTEVEVIVPRFQSLQSIVLVLTANARWGIPELAILERTSIADAITYRTPDGRKEVLFRDGTIPLVSLGKLVGDEDAETTRDVIVVSTHGGPLALSVPGTLGVMEVAPKRLGGLLRSAPFVTGAAMVSGEIAMLIDTDSLMEVANSLALEEQHNRKTILIVDDSIGVRQVLAAALTAGGFDVVAAASSIGALNQLANNPIDAMVVDYAMPGQDGVELVTRVRETYGDMPVVMISGVADEADRKRAEASGIDAFFEKSDFREGALASMLISLLNDESPMGKTAQ